MTTPSEKTLKREKGKLYITDAELIRRLGCPMPIGRAAIRALDKDPRSRFPPKQKLFGDRRYWPAVRAYFDAINSIPMGAARLAPEHRTPLPVAAPSLLRSPMRRAANG